MNKITYDHLKMLESKNFKADRHSKPRLKVYYGWSKVNKVQKREAIAVVFENEQSAGWEKSRSGKMLRKQMNICYEREQTELEMSDAPFHNRVFTTFYIFLDDRRIGGSLRKALSANSDADKNHVGDSERRKISQALEMAFLSLHRDYQEPVRELELSFKD